MTIRQTVADFFAAGPLPDEDQPAEAIQRSQDLLERIEIPIADEEAASLLARTTSPSASRAIFRPGGDPDRTGCGHRRLEAPTARCGRWESRRPRMTQQLGVASSTYGSPVEQ
jgi:hypothetical protein